MREASQPLTRRLGRPFWVGYAVTSVLFFILLSALGSSGDSLAFWLFACVAVGMVGPVGGLFVQAIHDLLIARRLRLVRSWDFLLLITIVAAFFVAGYVSLTRQVRAAHFGLLERLFTQSYFFMRNEEAPNINAALKYIRKLTGGVGDVSAKKIAHHSPGLLLDAVHEGGDVRF